MKKDRFEGANKINCYYKKESECVEMKKERILLTDFIKENEGINVIVSDCGRNGIHVFSRNKQKAYYYQDRLFLKLSELQSFIEDEAYEKTYSVEKDLVHLIAEELSKVEVKECYVLKLY